MLNIFSKQIPEKPPKFLLPIVTKLRSLKTKDAVIEESMKIVAAHLDAKRTETYLFIHLIFRKDLEKIWDTGGFAHCTTLNYFVRCFMVWSGKFSNEEIKNRWTAAWFFSPHQYLRVYNLKSQKQRKHFDIDPWGYQFNIPLGKHAWGFNQSLKPNIRSANE